MTKKSYDLNESTEEVEYVAIPPDGGIVAWMAIFACFVAASITDGINICFGLILMELMVVFENESLSKISWVFSILIGFQMLSGPIISALVNRFGYRTVIMAGSVLGFIGLSTSYLAPSIDVLFVTIGVVCGMSFGLVWMPCLVSVGFYFEKRRALATGIVLCGTGVGTFIFAPFTAWLLETYGLRGTFLILSAVYLNVAVCGALLWPVPLTRRIKQKSANEEPLKINVGDAKSSNTSINKSIKPLEEEVHFIEQGSDSKAEKTKKEKSTLAGMFKFSLFKSPSFNLICLSSFFQLLGMLVPYMYIAAHAVNLGISMEASSFLLSIIGVAGTVGKIAWGFLADHPKTSTLLLNNISLTFCGILIAICPLLDSYELLIGFCVLLGLTDSCFFVLRPVLLGELFGNDNVNNAFGFMFWFCGVASLIGLPLTGFLVDTFGSYNIPFYFAGANVLLSAILCFPLNIINRREKK